MRVGLSIETDAPGGAETMLLHLTRELQGRGHEVFAIGTTGGASVMYYGDGRDRWLTTRFAELGVDRQLVPVRGAFGLAAVPELVRTIRRNGLDVLHSHEFSMSICGAIAARMAGCRHVITIHGSGYFTETGRRRLALRAAAAMSAHTVAVSEALRSSCAETLGMPERTIQVVHNGVAALPGDGAGVRAELGISGGEVMVLAVGSLLPVKGHTVLIDAMARLAAEGGGIALAIAGRGLEEDRLRRLAAERGIADRVHLLGYRSDIADLLDAADIFAMPSLSEGLPMAVIEAMLAGKPIIASDVGGIGELLPSTRYGLLVAPGDADQLANALGELVRDEHRRARVGNEARSRAQEHFTATAMAEKYLALYGA